MSKRSEVTDEVVPSGPLGPWRLSLSIIVAAAFTGMPLSDAATTGDGLDLALLRSFGVAFLTWIAVGRVNRMLGQAELAAVRARRTEAEAAHAWPAADDEHLRSSAP